MNAYDGEATWRTWQSGFMPKSWQEAKSNAMLKYSLQPASKDSKPLQRLKYLFQLWVSVAKLYPAYVIGIALWSWILSATLIVVFVQLILSINPILEYVSRLPKWASLLFPTSFTVLLAWLLFQFRQKRRLWYGRVEVLFGIAAAYASSTDLSEPLKVVGIISSCYVIVRGFDNWREGANQKLCRFLRQNLLKLLEERSLIHSPKLLSHYLDTITSKQLLANYTVLVASDDKEIKASGLRLFQQYLTLP